MKIRLDLFRLLEAMIESVRVPKPKILGVPNNSYAGRYSVLIGFDGTNIPYPVVSGGPILPKTFFGEDPRSADLAEHKAIMSLVEHLKQTYGIEIHDISHFKIKECELKSLEVFSAMDHFKDKFSVFLNKYVNCMDDIQSILSGASEKHGNILDEIICSVDEIMQISITFIQNLKPKLIKIGFEENSYRICIEANAKKNPLKGPQIAWNISEKEALTKVMNYLGLLDAKYSTKISDGDLFTGACKVNIGHCYGEAETGRTKIKGHKKKTPYAAECSAAAEAIRFLERTRGFEIVDFNYDIMVKQKNKLCSVIHKRSKLDEMFGETNKSWGTFISTVEKFINNQYGLSQAVSLSAAESEEWAAKMDFMCELEQAVSSMKEMYYIAVSAMADNIE